MQTSKIDILLIEGDLAEAEHIKRMLSEARQPECSVLQAQDLAQGLSLLGGRNFAAVLVDLWLPDSQGLETALAVRKQSPLSAVVMLTVFDDESVLSNSLQSDIQDYLIKGEFDSRLLLGSIRYAMQRKRDFESLRESREALRRAQSQAQLIAVALAEGESRCSSELRLFSKAFRAAPTLISISTLPEGRYVDVNDEFLRTLEFERDEIIGHTAMELGIWLAPQDRELMIRMLREKKKVRDFETRLRSKGGAIIQGLLSMEIIEIEAGESLLTITRDVSDLRKAQEERARLALIVDSSDDAIIGKTLEGTITSWNKGAEKIYGFSARDVKGKSISMLAPADFPDEIPRILEKIKQGEAIERLETTRIRKDGRLIPVSLTISPIRDENGAIVGASTIARDISDRKNAEREIMRLNADLAARAAELESANTDLEAFNYTVAHDLRQPLTVINSYCQAIETLCGDRLSKDGKELLQGIYDGSLRMNRLIEALLDFSRLAHAELRRESVDLSALAHDVADELILAEPGRRVEFSISDALVALGDANLLRVALFNLIGNAWKFTGRRDTPCIEFGVRDMGGTPTYFIRDNGAGFDQAYADRLFAPFQRLPSAEEFRGVGIGLATVARIIRRHGGRVWAEGRPGEGATFFFTLAADPALH